MTSKYFGVSNNRDACLSITEEFFLLSCLIRDYTTVNKKCDGKQPLFSNIKLIPDIMVI